MLRNFSPRPLREGVKKLGADKKEGGTKNHAQIQPIPADQARSFYPDLLQSSGHLGMKAWKSFHFLGREDPIKDLPTSHLRPAADSVIKKRDDPRTPRWMQTNFEARNINYVPILMTSDPPQRRLSFALDNTRYEVVLTLTNLRPEMVPLK